ncbi:MAG: iron chelate uptake ABC transporter family permease subunit, partial [Spirochaetales bacterium]|nr:iron chelate uptake ABC transporter family permease subunit [Spirochaetales bacterium]
MISDSSRKRLTAFILFVLVVLMAFVCLFVGSSRMSVADGVRALARKSTAANNRIIWNIRLPRVLAALIAGAGLAVSGLIMQTNLNNSMASPS